MIRRYGSGSQRIMCAPIEILLSVPEVPEVYHGLRAEIVSAILRTWRLNKRILILLVAKKKGGAVFSVGSSSDDSCVENSH